MPDVAADATGHTGMAMVLSDGGSYTIRNSGGTSASAPFWAGLIALADQYAGRHLGFVNPAIYQHRPQRALPPGLPRHHHGEQHRAHSRPGRSPATRRHPAGTRSPAWAAPNASELVPLLARRHARPEPSPSPPDGGRHNGGRRGADSARRPRKQHEPPPSIRSCRPGRVRVSEATQSGCWRTRSGVGARSYAGVVHLGLITIVVSEYDPAISFFVEALGFELVEDSPALTNDGRPKRWVVVRPPGAVTGLLLARADGEGQAAMVGKQAAARGLLHVEDFGAAYTRMASAGVKFVTAPRAEAYGQVAVFLDIAGGNGT